MKTFDKLKKPTLVERFVQERIESLEIAADRDKQEAAKQGVSVRLPLDQIRDLDRMAKQLQVSRHALLVEIITSGLSEAVSVWSKSKGDNSL